MHQAIRTTALALLAVAAVGCAATARGPAVQTTPSNERSIQRAGMITARGDYAPDQHGPYDLHGRYRVQFTQFGIGVDFRHEVPFTAQLEGAVAAGPAPTIKLFERAAASGTTTIHADGRFRLVVDFGDSPYRIVLTAVAG